MKRANITIAAVAIVLVGCAHEPPSKPLISDATILLGAVSAAPAGRNWRIASMAEESGRRFRLYTFATSCDDQSGRIYADAPSGRYEPTRDAYIGGNRPEDRLLSSLCAAGIPIVDAQMRGQPEPPDSNSLSPAGRAILFQHLLNNAIPPTAPATETRCMRVPGSRTGEVTCTTK